MNLQIAILDMDQKAMFPHLSLYMLFLYALQVYLYSMVKQVVSKLFPLKNYIR